MLTEVDKRLLDHVYRYRLTTPEAVHSLFFADATLEDARDAYRRLRREGYLAPGFLWRGQPYYCLGSAALTHFPNARVGPIAEQDVINAFALLAFCRYGQDATRNAITREELKGFVPQLIVKQLGNDRYYLDAEGGDHRLGLLKVDRGFNYRRSGHQLVNLLRKRTRFPAWKELIEQGRLTLTFATAWEEKAPLIQATLDARTQPVPYRVVVVPELRHLLARKPSER